MSVIELKDLTKDYGDGKGVFNLSFAVEKGEAFGFLGPNGAGKTTAIRHLMGFIKPDGGSCGINGLDCRRHTSRIQTSLGYIPGEIAFMDEMTGIGFIQFLAGYRGLKDLSRARALMERFELDPKGRLKKMSKGMKQKVGIVCAFMHDPDVLILDEPSSGLDPLMQTRFVELILEERKRGKTILMSSHIFEEVERTCTRVGILRRGRLVAVDAIETLKRARSKKYILTMETPAAAADFREEPFDIPEVSGRRVTVTVKNDLKRLIEAMNRYPVENIEAASQSLEEVFMHYYGGEQR